MAMVDVDRVWRLRSDRTDDALSMPTYPEDQIDFGYEIVASRMNGTRQARGPEGLSLAARVYE